MGPSCLASTSVWGGKAVGCAQLTTDWPQRKEVTAASDEGRSLRVASLSACLGSYGQTRGAVATQPRGLARQAQGGWQRRGGRKDKHKALARGIGDAVGRSGTGGGEQPGTGAGGGVVCKRRRWDGWDREGAGRRRRHSWSYAPVARGARTTGTAGTMPYHAPCGGGGARLARERKHCATRCTQPAEPSRQSPHSRPCPPRCAPLNECLCPCEAGGPLNREPRRARRSLRGGRAHTTDNAVVERTP